MHFCDLQYLALVFFNISPSNRYQELFFSRGSASNSTTNLTFLDSIHNMDFETPFTTLAPPVFKGKNYKLWASRMKAHLEANDLWEAVEEDYEVIPLTDNPTMA